MVLENKKREKDTVLFNEIKITELKKVEDARVRVSLNRH